MAQISNEIPLEALLAKLREDPYRIGVFGEFSTGKSTFLNALMGEDILSVATEPTTATPTRIQYARVFNVLVYGKPSSPGAEPPIIASLLPIGSEPVWARLMKDGLLSTLQLHHETTSIRLFLERWTKEGSDADKTHEVLIQLPQPFLKGRIALLDTPGVNNEFTKHQGITERVLNDVDLALCLIDARQGGKASEMDFIKFVAKRAALTRVVVNKIDLIDEDEREELLEAVHETLKGFWPDDCGPCPEPWTASSLASLDPGVRGRFPKLAEAFNELRENLKGLAESQRGNRILARCGNWDQVRLQMAHQASEEGRFAEAHECLLDVLTLYQETEIKIPGALPVMILECEEAMKGATSQINLAHALVDKAALILLRNEPNDEVRGILRQAGEIFLNAGGKDPVFEKLARQALGADADRYVLTGLDAPALTAEAWNILEGKNTNEYERGIAILSRAAEMNWADAQNKLGLCLELGKGIPEDPAKATEWYRKAAEQGLAKAQRNLGICYIQGGGVHQDNSQAIYWIRKAADQGMPEAQTLLGDCYSEGIGVTQDFKLAANWFRKAAELGCAEAQMKLGLCYEGGRGVTQSIDQAVIFYQQATELGDLQAMVCLGTCLINGTGIDQDQVSGFELMEKSAMQGNPAAKFILSYCYYNAIGTNKDKKMAVDWCEKAANDNNEDAKEFLKKLKINLSENEILAILQKYSPIEDLYIHPNFNDIPNKLFNAREKCNVPAEEKVLGLLDLTVFGSAKDSIVFGDDHLFYHNLGDQFLISYYELNEAFSGENIKFENSQYLTIGNNESVLIGLNCEIAAGVTKIFNDIIKLINIKIKKFSI